MITMSTEIKKYNAFVDASPFTKLIFSIFILFVSLLLFLLLGVAMALPIFKISLSELQQNLNQVTEGNVGLLKYFQVVQSFGIFIVPPVLLAILFTYPKSPYGFLYLDKKPLLPSIGLVILITLCALPFINFTLEMNTIAIDKLFGPDNWMKQIENNADLLTKSFLHVNNFGGALINIFVIALLPAFGEEFLFRGLLQRIFTDWTKNKHVAIIICAALFSALHIQFYGFVPRFLLGLFFGYLLVWSGTLWLPIIAHFINNATAVIFYYMYNANMIGNSFDTIGTDNNGYAYAFASLIMISFLIYLFYRNEKLRSQPVA